MEAKFDRAGLPLSWSIVLAVAWNLTTSCGAVLDSQIEPRPEENFAAAQFRLWVDEDAGKPPQAVLAVFLAAGQNGLHLADDPSWRTLASRLGCALLAGHFVEHDDATRRWDRASHGTGRALVEGLMSLAGQLDGKTGEWLRQARLIVVGNCAGGQFAYHFAGFAPERAAGFASVKGGGYHQADAAAGAAKVPGLFITAGDEEGYRRENILKVFEAGRKVGARWTLAVEPGHGHDPRPAAPLLAAFLGAVLPVDNAGPSSHDLETDAGFQEELRRFRAGEPLVAPVALCFDSKEGLDPADVAPGDLQFGDVDLENATNFPFAEVRVSRKPGAPSFDRVWVPGGGPWSAEVVEESADAWRVRVAFRPDRQLPLGAFHGILPLRFSDRGRTLLAARSVGVGANLVGPVLVRPAGLYLGRLGAGETREEVLRVSSRSGEAVRVVGVESSAPEWARAEVDSGDSGGAPEVAVRCRFHAGADVPAGGLTAQFRLRVEAENSNRPWDLVVRVAGCKQQQSAAATQTTKKEGEQK